MGASRTPGSSPKTITVWDFEFSPDGESIVFGGSEKNLVDYEYMFQDIYLLDVAGGAYRRIVDLPGQGWELRVQPGRIEDRVHGRGRPTGTTR